GDRVDEVAAEVPGTGLQLVVLAAERDDLHAGVHAAEPRHAVGLEPGAVDEQLRPDRPRGGLRHEAAGLALAAEELRGRPDPPAGRLDLPGVGPGDRDVIDDPGLRNEQPGDPADVRLVLAQ